MEIKNLIDITPEVERAAGELFEASEKLKELLGNNSFFTLDVTHNGTDHISIFDRRECSRDGLGTSLGFFIHRLYIDGTVRLDFLPEDNEDAKKFSENFEREFHGEALE